MARKAYQPAENMSDLRYSSEEEATRITLYHTNSYILAPPPTATARETGINEEYLPFIRDLAASGFGIRLNGAATEESTISMGANLF